MCTCRKQSDLWMLYPVLCHVDRWEKVLKFDSHYGWLKTLSILYRSALDAARGEGVGVKDKVGED